jgi:hypothetical protein
MSPVPVNNRGVSKLSRAFTEFDLDQIGLNKYVADAEAWRMAEKCAIRRAALPNSRGTGDSRTGFAGVRVFCDECKESTRFPAIAMMGWCGAHA